MRKMKRPPAEEHRKKRQEPLAEGLQIAIPKDSRGRIMWSKMSDEEIIEYANEVLKKNGIIGKKELLKRNPRLYEALYRRGLFSEIGLENKCRSWSDISDQDIVKLAKKLVASKGMARKKELKIEDNGLYQALYKRGLLDSVGFKEKQRSWEDIEDEEVIRLARKLMKENGISGRMEFQKVDLGLYMVLMKRGISDKIGFLRKRRAWKEVSDEELIEHAEKVMEENEIASRVELKKADAGIYETLRKRKLLGHVGFEYKQRSWDDICDEDLVRFAKRFLKRKNITGRHELEIRDGGLYKVLLNRGLIDEIGFENKRRSWKDMTDDDIIAFVRKIIEKNEIESRSELEKFDSGVYEIIRKRGLTDRVFSRLDQQKIISARDAVIDALEAFAANDNNSAEDDVA